MIEFKGVHLSYDGCRQVLRDVSFAIGDGEFVAFIGPNGTGKSTAMRLVNGLLLPDEGEVLIDGAPTTALRTSQLARRVGFLFQNPDRQICCGTVLDELLFGFRVQGRLDGETMDRARRLCEDLGLDPQADPFRLSRGSRQLLALASAVVMEPEVLVLDEPTTGLDYCARRRVMDIVQRVNKQGATVLAVCHDMELVAEYAKRCIVLREGRVAADGPVFEVLRDFDLLRRASLLPPQMVELSRRLADGHAECACDEVRNANTVEEVVRALERALHAESKGVVA